MGCSNDSATTAESTESAGGSDAGTDVEETADAASDDSDDDDAAVSSSVDCEFLRDQTAQGALVGLQLIPQMTSQDQVGALKSGALTFDTEALLTYLTAAQGLAGTDTVFGDPASSIEQFIAATKAAQAILAIDGPVPDEQLAEYRALVGDTSEFIMRQAALGAALDEVCPS
ncbi:MAG: hypothetical protein O3C27_11470 [Actinomycetota bacterium]|nr:hypothetical protein [Actinomycetota bacterium]